MLSGNQAPDCERTQVSVVVVLFLELGGRDVAEARVQPGVVEPAEVFDERKLELRAAAPDAIGDQLGLEALDERLGEPIVVSVADRSDRREQALSSRVWP